MKLRYFVRPGNPHKDQFGPVLGPFESVRILDSQLVADKDKIIGGLLAINVKFSREWHDDKGTSGPVPIRGDKNLVQGNQRWDQVCWAEAMIWAEPARPKRGKKTNP